MHPFSYSGTGSKEIHFTKIAWLIHKLSVSEFKVAYCYFLSIVSFSALLSLTPIDEELYFEEANVYVPFL